MGPIIPALLRYKVLWGKKEKTVTKLLSKPWSKEPTKLEGQIFDRRLFKHDIYMFVCVCASVGLGVLEQHQHLWSMYYLLGAPFNKAHVLH